MREPLPNPPLVRGGENTKLLGVKFIPYDKELVSRARELRLNQTSAEKIFWKALVNNKAINYKFTSQKPIGNFIVDFYCAKLLLAIEIDGEIHLASGERDQERTDILNFKYGIFVIRYTNSEIINNIKKVFDDLLSKIKYRVSEFPPDKGD